MPEVNVNNVVQEFRTADYAAMVEATALNDLQYRNYFPLEFNIGLEFSAIEKAAGAKVMADIVALGSRAPRKGRDFAEKNMGTLAKIEIARTKDEYDLFRIESLRNAARLYPTNSGVASQLVEAIYDDVTFTIDGVNARLEYGAKQLASTGKMEILAGNNATGVKNITLDYGVKTVNASKSWSDPTADPIKDIQTMQDESRKNGFRLVAMTMDAATFNQLLNSQAARAFVYGAPVSPSTVLPIITTEQLNAQLEAKKLPIVNVWDSFVQHEGKDGVRESLSGWAEGNVLFTVEKTIGTTKYTLSQEFKTDLGGTIAKSIKDNFILSKMWGENDPVYIHTKATAFALPVMRNAKRNLILKTKLA